MEEPSARPKWRVRKIGLGADDGALDRAVAAEMTAEKSMLLVSELAVRLEALRGEDAEQQRLRRTLTRVKRGRS